MSLADKVVWSEGMFLRPQHFQQHDRYIQSFTEQRVTALGPFAWGITQLKLDEALLSKGKVALAECKGVFPDGTPFDIPEQNGPCPPMVVDEGVKNATVYLAVPLLRQEGAEATAIDDKETLARYIQGELKVQDSNANAVSKEPVDIVVGKLRLRLLLVDDSQRRNATLADSTFSGGDPRADYSYIAVARIRECKGDGAIELEKDFIPACIDCRTTLLDGWIKKVLDLLDKRAAQLVEELGETGRGGASEFYNFLALQVINRYQPLFAHWSAVAGLHPLILYEGALQLAGELATLTSDTRRPPEFPRYHHTDLRTTFAAVMRVIWEALTKVKPSAASTIPIREDKFGFYVAIIKDRNLLTQASFVLAVKGDVPTEKLRRDFPTQATVGSPTEITRLVKGQMRGIGLYPMPVAPLQIPFHAGFCYFELDPRSKHWKGLAEAGGIAFHLTDRFPGLEMNLWAIRS